MSNTYYGETLEEASARAELHGGPHEYGKVIEPQFKSKLVYDFVVDKPPSLRWIAQDLLGSNDLVMVTADPMVGKSWLVSHLACSLSSGRPFLGKFAVPSGGLAVIVDEEQHMYEAWRRFRRLVDGYKYSAADVNNVRYFNRPGLNIDADPQKFNAFFEHLKRTFGTAGTSAHARLVILDSLSRLHRTPENDAVAMAYLLERIRLLQYKLGCALVFIHHGRKAAVDWRGKTVDTDPSQAPRGSSDLRAVVDQHWYLRRVENGRFNFIHDKHRTGPKPVEPFDVVLVDSGDGTRFDVEAATKPIGAGGLWARALPVVEKGVLANLAPSKIHAECKAQGISISYEYCRKIIKKVTG